MAIVLFTTCNKDDDSSGNTSSENPSFINAKNVVSNGDIVSVKALMENYITEEDVVIATSKFENNGFTMVLPTPPEQCLYEVRGTFNGIVSDLKAKIGFLNVGAFNMKDKKEGALYFLGISANYYVDAYYIYADRDFTVKGQGGNYYYTEYNCSFKKGWNILYYVENSSGNKTYYATKKPAEVTMEWVFDDYFDYSNVRFIKEGVSAYDCYIMGIANNYYGVMAYEYFWDDSGESRYYKIAPGNHYTFHYEYYSDEEFIDIDNYYFAEDTYYSVICSKNEEGELNFRITQDTDEPQSSKSMKLSNPLQIHKPSVAKRIALKSANQ